MQSGESNITKFALPLSSIARLQRVISCQSPPAKPVKPAQKESKSFGIRTSSIPQFSRSRFSAQPFAIFGCKSKFHFHLLFPFPQEMQNNLPGH